MSGRSSAVERHLAKVDVESSILFARSNLRPLFFFFFSLFDQASVRLFIRLLFQDALIGIRHGRRMAGAIGFVGLAHRCLLTDPRTIAGQVVALFFIVDGCAVIRFQYRVGGQLFPL